MGVICVHHIPPKADTGGKIRQSSSIYRVRLSTIFFILRLLGLWLRLGLMKNINLRSQINVEYLAHVVCLPFLGSLALFSSHLQALH